MSRNEEQIPLMRFGLYSHQLSECVCLYAWAGFIIINTNLGCFSLPFVPRLRDVSSKLSPSEFKSSESSYSDDSIGCFRLKGFLRTLREDTDAELGGDKDELVDDDNDDNDNVRGDLTGDSSCRFFLFRTFLPFIFLESKSEWLLSRTCFDADSFLRSNRLATIFLTLVAMTLLVTMTVIIECPAR